LLVTCVPFVTMVVGRYGALAPAIWLYCAITILAALVALRLAALAEPHIGKEDAFDRRIGLGVIIVLSLIVVAFSLVQPRHAMWIYLLNIFAPAVRRWVPAPKQ
jgi:uncharacterized membrane protein